MDTVETQGRPRSMGNVCIAETEWGERDRRGGVLNSTQVREDESLFNRHSTGIDFSKYEDIPVQASEQFTPISSFDECNFHSNLKKNLRLLGYTAPSPVQKYVLSAALQGKDIIAVAQTGSGKTAAYLLPILHKMLATGPPANSPLHTARPVALILAPTRELAIQIHEETRKLVFMTGIRAVVVYGGTGIHVQTQELASGCDVIVGTPGRMMDFMERGLVQLVEVRYVVLDEADRMLDMGFEPQVRRILQGVPLPTISKVQQQVQTTLCSATFANDIIRLAYKYTTSPLFMSLGKVGSATNYITHEVYYSDERKKVILLHQILQTITGLVLIFVQTKRDADSLTRMLQGIGYVVGCIHGDRVQAERERALAAFRSGSRPILVATDVAQRGLDIPNVAAVINFDPPQSIEDYVHRVGRTGRAGRDGKGVCFLGPGDQKFAQELYVLFEENKQTIPQWFREMVGRRAEQSFVW